jgi:hypothetical protein
MEIPCLLWELMIHSRVRNRVRLEAANPFHILLFNAHEIHFYIILASTSGSRKCSIHFVFPTFLFFFFACYVRIFLITQISHLFPECYMLINLITLITFD